MLNENVATASLVLLYSINANSFKNSVHTSHTLKEQDLARTNLDYSPTKKVICTQEKRKVGTSFTATIFRSRQWVYSCQGYEIFSSNSGGLFRYEIMRSVI